MDCCTTLEDALRLAALNQCLLRMLYRLRRANQRWRMYSHLLLGENRWRAMRYSYDAGLLDLGQQRIVPFAELLEELIALVHEDAEALGCVAGDRAAARDPCARHQRAPAVRASTTQALPRARRRARRSGRRRLAGRRDRRMTGAPSGDALTGRR